MSASWSFIIHDRAFQCSDDTGAFLGFIGELDSCRIYDTLADGWSWERIETIRRFHVATFWIITSIPVLYVVWIIFRSKQYNQKLG